MTAKRDRPLVIAHRGASADRPENTVEAFRYAAVLGADGVELDVRRSADGLLVVHHDARLPDGRAIVELPGAELPESIPTLDQALDACVGLGVDVEIKNDPRDPDFEHPSAWMSEAVVDRLTARAQAGGHPFHQLLVTSFDPGVVSRVHRLAPSLPVGQLLFDPDPSMDVLVGLQAAYGYNAVNPWDPLVDRRVVDSAHRQGLAVHVWTVDDVDRMAELASLGVDGIITNRPDWARAVVDRSVVDLG